MAFSNGNGGSWHGDIDPRGMSKQLSAEANDIFDLEVKRLFKICPTIPVPEEAVPFSNQHLTPFVREKEIRETLSYAR